MDVSRVRTKISPPLAARIETADPNDMLVVIVELEAPAIDTGIRRLDRQGQILKFKDLFEHEAEPVQAAIESVGGKVLDRAWINHTMRARVPVASLSHLCLLDNIDGLYLPAMIERE